MDQRTALIAATRQPAPQAMAPVYHVMLAQYEDRYDGARDQATVASFTTQ